MCNDIFTGEKQKSHEAEPFGRFLTREDARGNARRILKSRKSRPYTPITGLDAEDVRTIFDNHPIAQELAGKGVAYHFVAPGGRAFRTMRVDGTAVPWSYRTAIFSTRWSAREKLRDALRQEARGQIEAFLSNWRTSADYDPSVEAEGAEVDHVQPGFAELATDFELQIIERYGTLDAIEIVRGSVGEFRFVDRSLAKAWRKFHAERATLEVVGRSEHKRRTRERRLKSAGNNTIPCTEAA